MSKNKSADVKLSRRNVLAGSLVAAGSFVCPFSVDLDFGAAANEAPDAGEPLSDGEIAEVLKEEGEPGFVPRAVISNFWFQQSSSERPSPHWPSDDVSYDYRPLAEFAASGAEFDLSGDVLRVLAERNAFDLGEGPVILFGLRGCTVSSGKDYSPPAAKHAVVTTRPDHLNMRCLIGVWDRTGGNISLCRGSTVPNVDLMDAYVRGALGCNMLPTGLHQYKVGPHRGNKQPGAFRQQQSLWILRSPKNLSYAANDRNEIWDDMDGNLPFDNIHAAILNYRTKPPFFSSAGCQVVAGRYKDGVPVGAWANFRQDAGLVHPPVVRDRSRGVTDDDGKDFTYFVLTGDEASIVSSHPASEFKALRYGSSGPSVVALQERLGMAPDSIDGIFLRGTLGRYLSWQRKNGEAATGIVTKSEAERLGISL
ncbi:peptidoglycan-binding domain-containing protein [Rhizobium mongolense]|uniref:Uncharacterized protein n=1 Tax=Rhizobium mongolense TaxID=57676 RepID=A0A7W6RLI2_9HYPH|nr:hypothetical protein [Rhizobium mongolense]MBB4274677.1 hypothetical protein [Rhizobium mongolense]